MTQIELLLPKTRAESKRRLRVAKASMMKFVEHAARLYEQDRNEPSGPSRLGMDMG